MTYSYGSIVEARAIRLLRALLLFANWEIENPDHFDIRCSWSDEHSSRPKLMVKTKLRTLADLVNHDDQDRYGEAEPLLKQSLEMRQKRLGPEHPDVATSLNNLAVLYKSQGRYGEAEPLYKQALEMRQKLLGQEHPDVAVSLNNLALLYKSQGRYEKAEPLYKQVLEMYKKLLGQKHPILLKETQG